MGLLWVGNEDLTSLFGLIFTLQASYGNPSEKYLDGILFHSHTLSIFLPFFPSFFLPSLSHFVPPFGMHLMTCRECCFRDILSVHLHFSLTPLASDNDFYQNN